ncbi:MAG: RNase adaptor protein RapZ, partial [Oscillospiraceae bacterium]|nr:RNase adaptor protein RapZ [Oscillospiraceae bacterium]
MEILVISGLSGAGKSSAATALEDIGYYTVDNVPPAIIPKFAEFSASSDGRYDRVALVSDIRGGSDSFSELLDVIEKLRSEGTTCRLLYLSANV